MNKPTIDIRYVLFHLHHNRNKFEFPQIICEWMLHGVYLNTACNIQGIYLTYSVY